MGAALFGSVSGGDTSEGSTWTETVQTIVGLVSMLFGLWAVLRARRHLSWVLPDLDAARRNEGVVLFLRAFSDERGFARKVTSRPLRWLVISPPPITPSEIRTEEEQIARGVAPFGRMVALGPTSDRLPRAGANRSYASDDEWRSQVLAALGTADLVLLAAGSGDQLRWEVEQAVQRGDPCRLVIAVPRTRGQYADFREKVGGLFPKGLPELPGVRASRVRYVRAVVWFEPDWTPHLELLTGRLPLFRFAARTQRALPRALQPVYERAGLRPPVKNRTTRPRPPDVLASVAFFSVFWLGITGIFLAFGFVSIFSGQADITIFGHRVGLPGAVIGLVVVCAILATPWVVWMGRVLRAGPVAVLMLQLVGLTSGVVVVAITIRLVLDAALDAVELLDLIGLVFVLPGLPMFISALWLMRRDVRDWVDSRT